MEIELSSMLPTDWRDWDDAALDAIGGLDVDLGAFEDDLGFETLASPPDSPSYEAAQLMPGVTSTMAAEQQLQHLHLHHQQQYQHQHHHTHPFNAQSGLRDEDEELLALADGEVFMCEQEHDGVLSEHMFKCESFLDLHGSFAVSGNSSNMNNSSSTSTAATPMDAVSTKRKRCNADATQQHQRVIKEEPMTASVSSSGKKLKSAAHQSSAKLDEQAERLYRRRYDILHEILEAWNTGGIEDMEEIADSVYDDDVTLVSPDYAEGLRGVHAIMNHWNLLLDAFPDGIMEEYEIQREEGERLKATWVFSGTQIFPFFGVQPRHEKVCISGTSFFSFKGDKIRHVVLSWNYREALMKLMGVPPSKASMVGEFTTSSSLSSYASAVAQVAALVQGQR